MPSLLKIFTEKKLYLFSTVTQLSASGATCGSGGQHAELWRPEPYRGYDE